METEEELAKLEADGLPPASRVWVCHFFSHFGSSHAEHAAFHAALREGGFGTPGKFTEIGADEELTGDGYWHHWAFTVFEADPEVLKNAAARVAEIAAVHGVRYDGWTISRIGSTGQLRPVDD